MTPTLLEGVIAIILLWIAWRIGALLAPLILRRFRRRSPPGENPHDQENKPPRVIDI